MTPKDALAMLADSNPNLCDRAYYAARDLLLALLRRDWAVRVLDAADDDWQMFARPPGHGVGCKVRGAPNTGGNHAESRRAAALAVFPTLPADVRADLGKCP